MNVLLATIPIAFGLIYAPKVAGSFAMAKQPGGYDNKMPRDQQAQLTGWGKRAMAAHANGFEAFAPFAVGVLVAHVTGASPKWAEILAVTHVVARSIYPLLYMANIATLRSTVWGIGFACAAGLMMLPLF